ACKQWLIDKMASLGLRVIPQETTVTAHDGKKLDITNIIGSFNPEREDRILLLAHWDTRPIADYDPNESLRNKPILGADDGGSGVAVLLEVARQLQMANTSLGIDFLFADAEDYGVSNDEDSWCLGSTYWSKNPHIPNYKADLGILLDMVGAKEAKFRWETFSKIHAPYLLTTIWDIASRLGYSHLFIQADGAALTDDHVPVIKNLGIPTINIVNYDPNRLNGFGGHWHTHKDDLENIDPAVLQAVGHTLMTFLKQQETK
ncbi:M28 family peptidase, partial [Porphyromonas macacae]